MIDSGARYSVISESLYNDLPELKRRHLSTTLPSLHSVAGEPLDILGSLEVPLCMSVVQLQQNFCIARNITQPLILGWDFFVSNNVVLDIPNSKLQVHGMSVPLLHKEELIPIACKAVVATTVQIPANTEKQVLLRISNDHTLVSCDYTGVFEPENSLDFMFARTLAITEDGCIPVLVMNSTPDDMSLYTDTPVGQFYSTIHCENVGQNIVGRNISLICW
jgi:hypothetical protein